MASPRLSPDRKHTAAIELIEFTCLQFENGRQRLPFFFVFYILKTRLSVSPMNAYLPLNQQDPHFLIGEIIDLRYRNHDNGYSVMVVRLNNGRDAIVVGHTFAVKNESIAASGEWVEHPRYGLQFLADEIVFARPSSTESIIKVLSSGMIPSLGEALARRIVQRFGLDTFSVIEEAPHLLREVSGIGQARSQHIARHWSAHRMASRAMAYLASYGIKVGVAIRAYRHFGADLHNILHQDPYRLCEVPGISFAQADHIAKEIGHFNLTARIKAAILHVLHHANEEGHSGLPSEQCRERVAKLMTPEHPYPQLPDDAWEAAIHSPQNSFILEHEYIWSEHLYRMENECAHWIIDRIRQPALSIRSHERAWQDAIAKAENMSGIRLTEAQRQAVINAARHRVSIITGGPGTGKTTLLKVLLKAASIERLSVTLTAPTGKAAKRMEEVTGHPAFTVAKAIGQMSHRKHTIATDLWVIDETSMVDIYTFRQILASASDATNLIFIGDIHQLPSIGPGAVLRDLIQSAVVPVVTLDTVFRQTKTSPIVQAAHLILNGEMIPPCREDGLHVIYESDPEKILQKTVRAATECKDPSSVQVLSPMRKGMLGVNALNPIIQRKLSAEGAPRLVANDKTFILGDRIIHLKNNYELEVMNGEVGLISGIGDHYIEVNYDVDHRVTYTFDWFDQIDHAYALTVHKSQGSQYPVVVIPLVSEHSVMLCRPVLYTALTRAMSWCVIYAQPQAMRTLLRHSRLRPRHTTLARWLSEYAASHSAQP